LALEVGLIHVWDYGHALRFSPVVDDTKLEARVVEAVATTGATFSVAATLSGVGRLAAAVIVVVVDERATSAFSNKSIQSDWYRFVQQEAAPCTGRLRESFLDGKKARPEPIRLEIRNDLILVPLARAPNS
jgi:hypothetical protein